MHWLAVSFPSCFFHTRLCVGTSGNETPVVVAIVTDRGNQHPSHDTAADFLIPAAHTDTPNFTPTQWALYTPGNLTAATPHAPEACNLESQARLAEPLTTPSHVEVPVAGISNRRGVLEALDARPSSSASGSTPVQQEVEMVEMPSGLNAPVSVQPQPQSPPSSTESQWCWLPEPAYHSQL